MKTYTAVEAEAIPVGPDLELPVVIWSRSRGEIFIRDRSGGSWYEPGMEMSMPALFDADAPFVRLVPEP